MSLRLLSLLVLLCACAAAKADEEMSRRWTLGVGYEMRMAQKLSSDIDYEQRSYPSLFFSYRERWFQTLGEFGYYDDESRSGALNIGFKRQEYRQWFRAMLYSEKSWTPFVGAGVGVFQERVTTDFYGSVSRKTTDLKTTAGVEAGLHGVFYKRLFAGLGGKLQQDIPEAGSRWSWSLQIQIGFSPLK